MAKVRARVTDGPRAVDPPANQPEDIEEKAVVTDPGDELDASDRTHLDEALARSWVQARAGQSRPAELLLERLRAKR